MEIVIPDFDEQVLMVAQELAESRFGPGVDMGGRHNPTPTEMIRARRLVENIHFWACGFNVVGVKLAEATHT